MKVALHWLSYRRSYQNRILILRSDTVAQSASVRCSSRVWVFPTSILQRKNSRCIYVCIACGRYETSQHAFQNLKIILQSGPSAFKFNLKWTVIFLLRKFSHLQPPQAGRVGTNLQFLNPILQIRIQKRLLGFAQTRCSAQECASFAP